MKKLLIMTGAAAAMVVATSAFAEDGYLESEGDAFISLGHCAGPNTKIEVDLQMTELTFGTLPFGSYGDALEADELNHPMFELYISHSGDEIPKFSWECSSSEGKRQAMNCDRADLERHVISFDGMTRTYASTNVTSGGSTYTYTFSKALLNRTCTNPMSVFGRGRSKAATQSSHFGGASKMKVYGVRIWESGVLVKTFVPCLRDGVPGFKVIIGADVEHPQTVLFATGIDVSKVKYGGNILMDKDDPYVSTGVNDVYGGTVPGKRIYLDTGYYVKKNARVELDFAPLTPPWTAENPYGNHLFMHAQGPRDLLYIINLKQASACPLYWKIGTYETTAADIQFSTATDIRRTYTFNSNSMHIVTAGYTNLVVTTTAAKSITQDLTSYTLNLASYSYGSGPYAPMKIYGLKIFEDDALVKDFRPFVTNGVPGLIDALNPADQRFFTTYGGGAAGTNLVAEVGGNLDSHTGAGERASYLEFPETGSGIDTGYSVGCNSCIEADFSLWRAGGVTQELINQEPGSDSCYVAFTSAGGSKAIWFKYADTAGNTKSTIATTNNRKQFTADRHTGNLTIKCGDAVLYNAAMDANYACTRAAGSQTLKIGRTNAAMRLYRFKIYEYVNDVKTLQRDYVPCVTNGVAGLLDLCEGTFKPLTGGKVSGKGYDGQTEEFETVPQPTRVKCNGSGTLTCFAPSAQSYDWYEDGVKIPNETGDSLTLNWEREKAKLPNNIHTYSVVPVYEVFNEKVLGTAVSAVVEMAPSGTLLIIR